MWFVINTHRFEPFLPYRSVVSGTKDEALLTRHGVIAVTYRGTTYFCEPSELIQQWQSPKPRSLVLKQKVKRKSLVQMRRSTGFLDLPDKLLKLIFVYACDVFDWVDPINCRSFSDGPRTLVSLQNLNLRSRSLIGELCVEISFGGRTTNKLVTTPVKGDYGLYNPMSLSRSGRLEKTTFNQSDILGFAELGKFIAADYPPKNFDYVAIGASAELLGYLMRRLIPGAKVAFLPISGVNIMHVGLKGKQLSLAMKYARTCLGVMACSTRPVVLFDFADKGSSITSCVQIVQALSLKSRKVIGVSLNWANNTMTDERSLIKCLSGVAQGRSRRVQGVNQKMYKQIFKTLLSSGANQSALRVFPKLPMSGVLSGQLTAPRGGSLERLLLFQDIVTLIIKTATEFDIEQAAQALCLRFRVELDMDDDTIVSCVSQFENLESFKPNLEVLPGVQKRDDSDDYDSDDYDSDELEGFM